MITNLILNTVRHSTVHASSNSLESRQNQSALKSPTAYVTTNARPLVSQAAFATLHAGSPKAHMINHDNTGALQYDAIVKNEDVDLGKIFFNGVE